MQDVRRLPVEGNDEVAVTLDELAREGACRMIAAALEVEVDQYVGSLVEEVDEDGKRLVVRNGHARERGLTVGSGTMRLRAPRVNDKRVDPDRAARVSVAQHPQLVLRAEPAAPSALDQLGIRDTRAGPVGCDLRHLR